MRVSESGCSSRQARTRTTPETRKQWSLPNDGVPIWRQIAKASIGETRAKTGSGASGCRHPPGHDTFWRLSVLRFLVNCRIGTDAGVVNQVDGQTPKPKGPERHRVSWCGIATADRCGLFSRLKRKRRETYGHVSRRFLVSRDNVGRVVIVKVAAAYQAGRFTHRHAKIPPARQHHTSPPAPHEPASGTPSRKRDTQPHATKPAAKSQAARPEHRTPRRA